MDSESHTPRERGQVGIGTLIVFIAMVLVAAIAAGVLINTAGFLQSQAQQTGESSSAQVTNRVDVVGAVGEKIDSDAGTVGQIRVTVKRAPGASNIDLEQTIVQWTDDTGAYSLTYANQNPGSGTFDTDTVQDNDGSLSGGEPVLNDPADRVTLVFDADDIHDGTSDDSFDGDGLSEGATANLHINTQSGGTSTVILNAPQTLSGTSAVAL